MFIFGSLANKFADHWASWFALQYSQCVVLRRLCVFYGQATQIEDARVSVSSPENCLVWRGPNPFRFLSFYFSYFLISLSLCYLLLSLYSWSSFFFIFSISLRPFVPLNPPTSSSYPLLFFFFKCHPQSSVGDYYREYPLHCNFLGEVFHRVVSRCLPWILN